MKLTQVIAVRNLYQPHYLYHEACYRPLAKQTDTTLRLLEVPEHWLDPGCALCGKALTVHPVDEQMERDFMCMIDELEREYLV